MLRSETIVSVFASSELLERIQVEGDTPVFVDIDATTGALDRHSVAAHIHTGTRRILLEPFCGLLASHEHLRPLTEPRDILVEFHGLAPEARRRNIALGLWGWGVDAVEADPVMIMGGAAELQRYLAAKGVAANLLLLPAFAKRKDFPGAFRWAETVLLISGWSTQTAYLRSAAEDLARQLAFAFDAPAEPMPAKRQEAAVLPVSASPSQASA